MAGLELKPRLRVIRRGVVALGPGKVELLALIRETHSLNEAARRMDMSYMRAWTLVKLMNKAFRAPLVLAERGGKAGGGTRLTDAGELVLKLYQDMEQRSVKAAAVPWRELQKLIRE